MVYLPTFNAVFPLRGHLEFSGALFLTEIFEKVSFNRCNLRITRLLARNFRTQEKFLGIKIYLYLPCKYLNSFNNAIIKWF